MVFDQKFHGNMVSTQIPHFQNIVFVSKQCCVRVFIKISNAKLSKVLKNIVKHQLLYIEKIRETCYYYYLLIIINY